MEDLHWSVIATFAVVALLIVGLVVRHLQQLRSGKGPVDPAVLRRAKSLEALNQMRDRGEVDEDDYRRRRAEILGPHADGT